MPAYFSKMKKIESVIWDWNGTLLDDVDVCIDSINRLLSERGRNSLSRPVYREIFTFPVRHYYELAGFDLENEPFSEVAIQFIDLYREKIKQCGMFPDARRTLEWFSGRGYSQYLVSAMEHQFLMETLKNCGVDQYFDDYSGIHDHFADGKESMARNFVSKTGINPERTLFVGDTLHDFEVAKNLGMHCILVADGHQSEVRLLSSGCEVVKNLAGVLDLFSHEVPGRVRD